MNQSLVQHKHISRPGFFSSIFSAQCNQKKSFKWLQLFFFFFLTLVEINNSPNLHECIKQLTSLSYIITNVSDHVFSLVN